MDITPLSFCEFFEIHGSKFKPYPIRDLGEAAVGGITHSVFFFRIRKDPFNGFFALLVKVGILGSVSCVIGKLLVIFPNMPLYDLYAIFGMCAKMSCRAVLTCFGIALVFSVSVSVGRTVCKRMVLGTNHAIVILIVYILPPFVSAVHGHRPFVSCTENAVVIKNLLANMGSFVCAVGYNGFYLGKSFGHFFIYVIECYAIMYVAGSYYGFQDISVLITCGVGAFLKKWTKEQKYGIIIDTQARREKDVNNQIR